MKSEIVCTLHNVLPLILMKQCNTATVLGCLNVVPQYLRVRPKYIKPFSQSSVFSFTALVAALVCFLVCY